jgi:hypothetical protein
VSSCCNSVEQEEYDKKDAACKALEAKQARQERAAKELEKQIEKLKALYDSLPSRYCVFVSFNFLSCCFFIVVFFYFGLVVSVITVWCLLA